MIIYLFIFFLLFLQTLDRVYIQFQSFLDDPAYRDEHTLLVQLIHTFGKVGPNAEPKFRDECKYEEM